jgi:hypothetical protein
MTFHACSSLAPTPVKLQPAPTILSQESVHITLSITHHTRKRPSTGPRTAHGPHTSAMMGKRLAQRRLESVVVRKERRLMISKLRQKPTTKMPMFLSQTQ